MFNQSNKTLATGRRVLRQLSHDRRTIALIMVVPCALLIILRYVFNGQTASFNQIAPMMVAIFPLVVMFVVTSIATLRERTIGTLERLMTMPISKLSIIGGYTLAFSVLALLQALLVSWVMLGWLKVPVAGGALPIIVTAVICGFLGTAMGLFVSAFADSEFQAVQFMPAFVMPQLLVCGLFAPREQMAQVLQWLADISPLSYAVKTMQDITRYPGWSHDMTRNLIIVLLFALASLALGATTLKRKQA